MAMSSLTYSSPVKQLVLFKPDFTVIVLGRSSYKIMADCL